MANKVMVLVPNAIAEVLRRNRLDLAKIFDYTTLRSLVSVQDISAFLSLQRADKIDLVKTSNYSFLRTSWEQTVTSDEREELVSFVIPSSNSEKPSKELYGQFGDNLIEQSVDGKPVCPYEVLDVTRDAFIVILKPGYMSLQKDTAQHLGLVRKVLKVFYEYQQQHEVASTAIFGLYLQLLEAQGK